MPILADVGGPLFAGRYAEVDYTIYKADGDLEKLATYAQTLIEKENFDALGHAIQDFISYGHYKEAQVFIEPCQKLIATLNNQSLESQHEEALKANHKSLAYLVSNEMDTRKAQSTVRARLANYAKRMTTFFAPA